MSQERRERQKEKAKAEAGPRNWLRRAIYAVLIIAAFALAYYLGTRARGVRYIQVLLGQHKYDNFARCLSDRGVKMYGTWWCPHCEEQKEKFRASFEFVPYVECGVPGSLKGKNPVCDDAGIKHYPTWQFPPTGERVERVFTLEELSDRTGCPLP
jgi:hypothetical protein